MWRPRSSTRTWSEKRLELLRIGESLEATDPGKFRGPRRAGDGFACELSSSTSWSEHRRAMVEFLDRTTSQVHATRSLGASVVVDVAIEPGDLEHQPVTILRLDATTSSALARHGVELEISICQ